MRRFLFMACLLLLGMLAARSHAVEDGYPKVIFGEIRGAVVSGGGLIGAPLQVLSAVAQIELGPAIVVSAGEGAILGFLRAEEHPGRLVITLLRGPALLLNLVDNGVRDLHPGRYLAALDASSANSLARGGGQDDWVVQLTSVDLERRSFEPAQGFHVADSVMIRQQSYLDSLRIDVSPINQALVSLIRRLFPR